MLVWGFRYGVCRCGSSKSRVLVLWVDFVLRGEKKGGDLGGRT